MEIHVGMTGTRNGMTPEQKTTFNNCLRQLKANILHHGDCIGADADAHDIAEARNVLNFIHPPSKDELRAYKAGAKIYQEKNYFARNRDIVNASSVLIGTPATFHETGGGTWYTINYGIKQGGLVYIIYPDGRIQTRNYNPQGSS